MTDQEIIDGIQQPGRFDAVVASEADALRLVRAALPNALELPQPVPGRPYPPLPRGARQSYQLHPPEPGVANNLPHVK